MVKIGFMAGCCYGRETSFFLGVQFPRHSLPAQTYGIEHFVHPTQLYEASAGIIVLILTWIIVNKKRSFDGQYFLTFILLYIAFRTVNEVFRGDSILNYIFGFSQTQFIGLLLIFIGVVVYWFRLKDVKISKLVGDENI